MSSSPNNTTKTQTFQTTRLPRTLYPPKITYPPSSFKRQDESPDPIFYSQPRIVQHIDSGAISALQSYYASLITPQSSVLDICSSWTSHLPSSLHPKVMIGYGMNAYELSLNSHLTTYHIRDLNNFPSLEEIGDETMDVVICSVSVDYLTKPLEVIKEMRRVLRDGGTAHFAFGNRCFPTKVVGRWLEMAGRERRVWVGRYFWGGEEGGWRDVEEVILRDGEGGEDEMFVVRGVKGGRR